MSKKVLLTADSACDLSPELVERFSVKIYPMHVVLEGKTYDDGVDVTPDDIYRLYEEKKILPKTSAVNIGEYTDFFTPYLEQGYEIVHINLGSGLSATHNNCRLAASELEGVYVIDSCNFNRYRSFGAGSGGSYCCRYVGTTGGGRSQRVGAARVVQLRIGHLGILAQGRSLLSACDDGRQPDAIETVH